MKPQILIHQIKSTHLTIHHAGDFREDLFRAARKIPDCFLLDLTNVETIDSMCIGMILLTAKLLPQRCRFALVISSSLVKTVCAITRLDKIIPIYTSVEEALEACRFEEEPQVETISS